MENKQKYEGIYSILNSKSNILYLICRAFLYDFEVYNYRDDIVKSNSLAYKYWFAENVIDCNISIVEGIGAYIGYIDTLGEIRQLFISDTAFKWITFAKFKKSPYDYDENCTYSKLKHLRKNSVIVNEMFIPKETKPFILSTDMEKYLRESKDKAIARQMERELLKAEQMEKAVKRAESEDNVLSEYSKFTFKTKEILSNVRKYDIV